MSLLRASRLATRRRSSQIRWNSQIAAREDVDVVIVGGGPVGLALATALGELTVLDTPKQFFLMDDGLIGSSESIRESSLRVTLVEASDLSKIYDWTPSEGAFSNRVSSLTNASQTFLQGICTLVRFFIDLVD